MDERMDGNGQPWTKRMDKQMDVNGQKIDDSVV